VNDPRVTSEQIFRDNDSPVKLELTVCEYDFRVTELIIRENDPRFSSKLIVRENDPLVTSEQIVRENDTSVTSELIVYENDLRVNKK
jgi:hypothetical protein